MKKTKILKIMTDWASSPERKLLNSYGGCGYYRTVKVAEQLSPEYEVTVWNREASPVFKDVRETEQFYKKIFTEYDIIWMHYIDHPVTFAWYRAMATHFGKKLVMDIDDNYLEVDKGNPSLKKQNRGKLDLTNKVAVLGTILSEVDAITVSTVPLKHRLQAHIEEVHGKTVPIFVVPNCNDVSDWKFEPKKPNRVIIGYIGGLSHNDDFAMVLPAIKKILEKYPDVWFQVIGQMNMADAKKTFGKWKQSLRNRITLLNATKTQPEYPEYLSEQPWSIGIAPLIDSPFNKSKSHIKWMEYSMYKIPVVASNVYPYSKDVLGTRTIIDGETGLLCDTEEDWVKNLSLLIENEDMRRKLGENAYKFIIENWQYKDWKKNIIDTVKKIKKL